MEKLGSISCNVKTAALSVALYLCAILIAGSANAEILNYQCIVGQVKVTLRVDTGLLEVTETTQSDGTVVVGRYSDGAFGRVSDFGAAGSIPPAHQFVRIDGQKILFGVELKGKEDSAVLDQEMATLTVPRGRSGWCSPMEK
jgi:hypothetical protein